MEPRDEAGQINALNLINAHMRRAKEQDTVRIGIIIGGKMFKFQMHGEAGSVRRLPMELVRNADFVADLSFMRVIKSRSTVEQSNQATAFTLNAYGTDLGLLEPNT